MITNWLPARPASLFLLTAGLAMACSEQQQEPFERFSQSSVENSSSHGFVWFHHKPGAPLSGARYEAGVDTKAGFGLGVCRASRNGAVYLGKIYGQRCNTASEGKEVIVDDFDQLVSPRRAFWHLSPKETSDLSRALVGGKDASGKPLYVCIARYVTGWWLYSKHHGYQPGQYSAGKCTFAWEGGEVAADEFYLLATGKPAANEKPPKAERPKICLEGESTCTCKELVGCSRPGLCPCSPDL
jgi:hypothetical protein